MSAEQEKLLEMLVRATAPEGGAAESKSPNGADAEVAKLRAGWLGLSMLIEDAETPGETETPAETADHVVDRIVARCAIESDDASQSIWASGESLPQAESVRETGVAGQAVGAASRNLLAEADEMSEPAEEQPRAGSRSLSFSFLAGTLSALGLFAMAGTLAWSVLSHRNEQRPEEKQVTASELPRRESSPTPRTQPPSVEHPPRNQFGQGGFDPRQRQHVGPNGDSSATSVDNLAEDSRHGMTVDDEIAALGQVTALVKHDWYVETTHVGAIQQGVSALAREMSDDSL